MLGSNLSAVAGDGDMGGSIQSNACCPLSHVSVLNALNPRALARKLYPVGPPEGICDTIPYETPFLIVPFMNTSAGVCLSNAECLRSKL